MELTVRVVAHAKKERIKEEPAGLKVYVTAPAVDGKANRALIICLAKHFKVKRQQIAIVRGLQSRNKVVRIS